MTSELINTFGTHRGFGDTGVGCWAGFVVREKGSSSRVCLDVSVSGMSCWIGVKVENKAWMSRICAAENGLLNLEVFQKEKLKYVWAVCDLYGLIRFKIKTLFVLDLDGIQVTFAGLNHNCKHTYVHIQSHRIISGITICITYHLE